MNTKKTVRAYLGDLERGNLPASLLLVEDFTFTKKECGYGNYQ